MNTTKPQPHRSDVASFVLLAVGLLLAGAVVLGGVAFIHGLDEILKAVS